MTAWQVGEELIDISIGGIIPDVHFIDLMLVVPFPPGYAIVYLLAQSAECVSVV